jgi:hypothetical protein
MRIMAVCLIAACLAGCGTKYQDMGFTGGVAAEQIMADTWRIRARGNAYTGSSTIQDYVLLKAAETTQAAGGTHFQVISASDASRASTIVSGGGTTTTVVGNQAFTSGSTAVAQTVVKPGEDVYIRVLKLAPGQQAQGTFSAAEIIQFTGPRVKRG